MVSKQNQQVKQMKAQPRQTRFALRKLGTGLAAVAIATLITVGFTATGQAADNVPITGAPAVTAPAGAPTATPVTVTPATPTAQESASDSSLAKQTIINDQNNPTAIPEQNGLQHTLTVTVNGQSTTPGAGNSIINANELTGDGSFSATFTAKNTSQDKQRVDQIITLPGFNYYNQHATADPNQGNPVIDGTQVSQTGFPLIFNQGDADQAKVQINYAMVPGQMMSLSDLMKHPDFSWDKVIELQVFADLLPGQSYSMTIPMKIANLDQMKKQLATLLNHPATSPISKAALRMMNFGDLFYYWDAKGAFFSAPANWKNIRLGVPDLKATNELLHNASGYYVAQTLIKEGDHFTYSPIPAKIQALLPHVDSKDIHILNFANGSNADLLFTDGSYTIDTAPIFNALKNAGYATNIYPSGTELWPVYTYNATNHLNVTFTDRGDGNGPIPSLNLNPYVQVQQIFDPKNITIPVNSRWDQTDNLNAVPSIEYTNRKTMSLTAHPTLTFNQDPKSDLNTYQVDYSALPTAMVDGRLVVTKAGVYPVVFSHQINAQDVVTATAYVTVTETRDFSRTIDYVDQAGKPVAPSVTQTVSYLGTPQADGTIVWTPVTAGDDNFPAVTSPTVANMTPDQVTVNAMPIVTSGANETTVTTTVTVTYAPKMATSPTEKTGTRVIHYVDEQGNQVAPDKVQTVTLTGTTITDQLTGQSTTSWTSGDFPAVTSPMVKDMTASQDRVPSMTVTAETGDQVVTVVYSTNPKGNEDKPVPPASSETPGQPNQPAEPGTPSQPTTPIQPVAPSQPETPEQPTTPKPAEKPGQPTEPIHPAEPGQPTIPVIPAAPFQPGTPQVPTTKPADPAPVVPVRATQSAAPTVHQHRAARLPQTGNKSATAAAALGLFGLTAGLGLLAGRKKQR